MLPKTRRIERKYYNLKINESKRYFGDSFILNVSNIPPHIKNRESKITFSVSKKVAKGAVLRNKLRRRAYSSITPYLKSLKSGSFLFFTFKQNPKNDYFSISKDIEKLLYLSNMLV